MRKHYLVLRNFSLMAFLLAVTATPSIGTNSEPKLQLTYVLRVTPVEEVPLRVTAEVQGISQQHIDFIISPMNIFSQGKDESLWLVEEIHAQQSDGTALPVHDLGISSIFHSSGCPIYYHLFRVYTHNQRTIVITYAANRLVQTGFLETLLLRPRDHALVGNAKLKFLGPHEWKMATVSACEEAGGFDLGSLDGMYGDNNEPYLNYVPALFALGPSRRIVEIQTENGRLIYADLQDELSPQQMELGARIFDFFSSEIGPLVPYNAYLVGLSREWNEIFYKGGQPGLYSFIGQHNRTGDLGQSPPISEFRPWALVPCPGIPQCILPDYAFYGFPHKLLRAWFMALIHTDPHGPDWFVRGGISHYFQEIAMAYAFGLHKVHERFQDLYLYYKKNYVETGCDVPLMNIPTNDLALWEFICYFKSGLWAYYLNQQMLEVTAGRKDLSDLAQYLYQEYGLTQRPLTIQGLRQAINMVAGADLRFLFTRYVYGREALPLDTYFEDDDGDGLMNGLEAELRTDPHSVDTDDDGISDYDEYMKGFYER